MWLIILLFSATISTALWYVKAEDDRYMLKFLSLIFWGASLMIFIDNLIGYFTEGAELLEITLESTILGFVLVVTALIIWEIALLIKDPKQVIHKKKKI
ncbi:MAG: hypothetical protein QXF28_03980 [Nitrososphaerota archaeon]